MAKSKTIVPDVTELLHADHQKVRDLFFAFKKAEDTDEKQAIVQEILMELHVHSTVEEELVYPVLDGEEEGEELKSEAETEHHVVKFLMAELSTMEADDEMYDSKVTVLCELVGHHVREEEKEMFKKLRESDADMEDLASQLMARKKELMKLPLPSMEATLSIDMEKEEEAESKKTSSLRKGRAAKTTRKTAHRKTA